jgi:hypothetical protein
LKRQSIIVFSRSEQIILLKLSVLERNIILELISKIIILDLEKLDVKKLF